MGAVADAVGIESLVNSSRPIRSCRNCGPLDISNSDLQRDTSTLSRVGCRGSRAFNVDLELILLENRERLVICEAPLVSQRLTAPSNQIRYVAAAGT